SGSALYPTRSPKQTTRSTSSSRMRPSAASSASRFACTSEMKAMRMGSATRRPEQPTAERLAVLEHRGRPRHRVVPSEHVLDLFAAERSEVVADRDAAVGAVVADERAEVIAERQPAHAGAVAGLGLDGLPAQVGVGGERQDDAGTRAQIVPQVIARVQLQHVEPIVTRIALHVDLDRAREAEPVHDVEAERDDTRVLDELEVGADAGLHGVGPDLLANVVAQRAPLRVDVGVEAIDEILAARDELLDDEV